jgi:hypothetical protein
MATRTRTRLQAILTVLIVLTLPGVGETGDCDALPALLQDYRQTKEQLEQLEAAAPFEEQFARVKGAVDGVHETLHATKADLDATKAAIARLLTEAREQNGQLRNVRRWARAVYSDPAREPAPAGGTPSLTLVGGLEQTSDWIDGFEKKSGEFAEALRVLEQAIAARDGRPSEQLEAFQKYLDTIAGKATSVKGAPAFTAALGGMFKYYSESIGLLVKNVKLIEAEYDRRDEILRQLGPEFNNVRYHWPRSTPWERRAQQQHALRSKLDDLAARLRACRVDPEAEDRKPSNDLAAEIRRAHDVAGQRCAPSVGARNGDEVRNRRNRALADLQRHYPRRPHFPVEYGRELSADEEIDWIQRRHEDWRRHDVEPAARNVERLEQEVRDVERRFQQYRRGALTLTTTEAERLNVEHVRKPAALEQARANLVKARRQAEAREASLRETLDSQARLRAHEACVRRWIEDVAKRLNWDPFWVSHEYPGLYHRPLAGVFEILRVDHPATVVSGQPRTHLVVWWRGDSDAPVRVVFSPVKTPAGNWYTVSHAVTAATENPVVAKEYLWANVTQTVEVVYAVVLEETTPGGRKTPPFEVRLRVVGSAASAAR